MALTEQTQRGPIVHTESRFVLAADLGQSNDPTAICVMQHVRITKHHWRGHSESADTFNVRWLERLPLGLSYIDQVDRIAQFLARPPLNESRCDFVIDETGVGRAVGDLFDEVGIRPTRVTITSGERQAQVGRAWHVSKPLLISTLDARLHTEELKFAAELREATVMADELQDFRRKVSAAGRYSYEARVGRHDDLVLAVALALWTVASKPERGAAFVESGIF